MELTAVPIADWIRHLEVLVLPSDAKNFQNADCCHATTDRQKEKKRTEIRDRTQQTINYDSIYTYYYTFNNLNSPSYLHCLL